MVTTPGNNPFSKPVVLLMDAVAGALLVQLPPVVASIIVVDAPVQIDDNPLIAAGSGLTVTTAVIKQPAPVV